MTDTDRVLGRDDCDVLRGGDYWEGNEMKYEETQYGFIYGAVDIQRMCSDEKEGWVTIGAVTAKSRVQIYVTKTGKIRVWKDGVEMQMPTAQQKRKAKK